MEAGRELDVRMARQLGWTNIEKLAGALGYYAGIRPDGKRRLLPLFSTSWDAMRKVIEAMRERGYNVSLHAWGAGVIAVFWRPVWEGVEWQRAEAQTLPHAVCLAALKAVGVEP